MLSRRTQQAWCCPTRLIIQAKLLAAAILTWFVRSKLLPVLLIV